MSAVSSLVVEGGFSVKSYVFTSTGSATLFRLVAVILVVAFCTVFTVPSAWSQESFRPHRVKARKAERIQRRNGRSGGLVDVAVSP